VDNLPTVGGLAAKIDADVAGSSLERLGAAAATAEELRQLGDSVVDRYVQAARADQRSWSQIREALGSLVRVSGVDVDPTATERDDFGIKCRVYRSAEGVSPRPPEQWIRAALT
jgi:hypothetical protein